jgi:choline dehydrogenase-like flavoprotein
MIVDLTQERRTDLGPYDVCIIGAGPAGLVLAAELSDAGMSICVIESGGKQKQTSADELRALDYEGIRIKECSRERIVGGASSTWSGLSAPLDPVDMSDRPFLEVPGWPISYRDLTPYWVLAADRYRFPSAAAFTEFRSFRIRGDLQPAWTQIDEKVFLAAGKPQRFGKEYAPTGDDCIDLFTNATVVDFGGLRGGDHVTHAEVACTGGVRRTVRAKYFVCAAGGIENCRLLLAARQLCPSGLGNDRDQVGRYFMNHPKNPYGTLILNEPIREASYFFGCIRNGYAGFAGLRLSEATQAAERVLNAYVRLTPTYLWSDNNGVAAAVYIAKRAEQLLDLWKQSHRGSVIPMRDYSETGDDDPYQGHSGFTAVAMAMLDVVRNPMAVAAYSYTRLSGCSPAIRSVVLRNYMEMEPHCHNRVTLSERKDRNGVQLAHVRHLPTNLDRRSITRLHEVCAAEVHAAGLGRLASDLAAEDRWPIDYDASHHMGGTRMGDDPHTSVVNRDLRLHSVGNVYCVGSSVFPTSGCANPTLTICALAIRLAEHLRSILRRST